MSLLLVLLVLLACTRAVGVERDINVVPADDRVLVEIYIESLCPYCEMFFRQQMPKLLSTPVGLG